MSEVADWISAIGTLAAGGAACVAVFQGLRSLSTWRRETAGKREFEVAEQALASFYKVREMIFDARAPLVEPHEMVDEEGKEVPAPLAPLRRFWRDPEGIETFRRVRHSFTALFGKERAGPYDEIEGALRSLRTACTMLGRDQIRPREDLALYQRLQRDAFRGGGEEDPLGAKVDAAVDEMEAFCRSIIVPYQEAHGSPAIKAAIKGAPKVAATVGKPLS